jgi:hypothetical protein
MFRSSRIDRRILLAFALSAVISLSASAITLTPGFSDNLVTAFRPGVTRANNAILGS